MGANEVLVALADIFVLLIPGYIFAKKKILNEEHMNGITSLVLNLTTPCIIIESLQMERSMGIIRNSAMVIASMAAVILLSFLLSQAVKPIVKLDDKKVYIFTYMMIFSNTGFIGIPVSQALYGQEGVFYAALSDSLCNIFIFTVGIILMQKATGKKVRQNYRDLLSPGLVAIIVGIIFFLANVTLPEIVAAPVHTIGSITTPLAMLIVGYQFGKTPLKDVFTDKDGFVLSAGKLLVVPAVCLMLVKLVFPEMSVFVKEIILMAAMPAAACSVIFAKKYGADTEYATKGVVVSTLLSLITIPVIAILLEL